ncbi:MAG: acetate--CoA ligase family protein [Calditrichia bacterium]
MELDGFFQPQSIAIIGASRKEGSLGRVFFDNLFKYNYTGKIYPINPKAPDINGIPCYAGIENLPQIPDMVVILVRKELAIEAVNSCGKKGVKNIIMITAGFREVGGDGAEREKQLLDVVKKYGMRMIGPNCMGIINTDPVCSMNASFSPTEPYQGNVAFVSQSGALGVAVLEMSKALRLGFSVFVSEGNKADLSDTDFLEYLQTHENTKVVTLYQESIEDADRFRKTASALSRKKPVIALKAGRSKSGAKAASSHTGALASSDIATDALFKQCGIIRADSIEELFEISLAFSNQPIPSGNRVAVITNAGGPAILATDAIERYGLEMAPLSEKTREKLKSFLPEEASVRNPVDMIASANEQTYHDSLETVIKDENVDAVMIIIVRPPVDTTPRMIAEGFRDILKKNGRKPVFIVLMAQQNETCGLEIFQDLNLPVYAYPESAARSISIMLAYQEWRKKANGRVTRYKVDQGSLKHIFESATVEGREYLRSREIQAILKAYGFPVPESAVVQSASEASEFFKKSGNPVVLKVESDDIVHKSDIGGVRVNLRDPKEIENAFDEIMENSLKVTSGDRIGGVLVQEMVSGGREVGLGMNNDPNYGPMIMFGMGGIFIEVFKDVSFRVAPVTDRDAMEMIESIKGFPVLKGVRGEKGINLELVSDTIQRLSQLALDWPQIVEMDLNPFVVSPDRDKCKIVDARIRIRIDG